MGSIRMGKKAILHRMSAPVSTDDRPVHYLEDLPPGLRFTTAAYPMTMQEIHDFAVRYDPQPFHLDETAADAHDVFRGLAASGWHTAAITMRLLTTSGPRLAGGVIGLGGEVTWPRPTRPGDVLVVHGEVTDNRRSRSREDRGIVTLQCTTRNAAGEDLQLLLARLLVYARGAQ
jgi:acyl dehydratase